MAVEDLANTPAERAAGYKNEATDLSKAQELRLKAWEKPFDVHFGRIRWYFHVFI